MAFYLWNLELILTKETWTGLSSRMMEQDVCQPPCPHCFLKVKLLNLQLIWTISGSSRNWDWDMGQSKQHNKVLRDWMYVVSKLPLSHSPNHNRHQKPPWPSKNSMMKADLDISLSSCPVSMDFKLFSILFLLWFLWCCLISNNVFSSHSFFDNKVTPDWNFSGPVTSFSTDNSNLISSI